jgi:hypothetical protein
MNCSSHKTFLFNILLQISILGGLFKNFVALDVAQTLCAIFNLALVFQCFYLAMLHYEEAIPTTAHILRMGLLAGWETLKGQSYKIFRKFF